MNYAAKVSGAGNQAYGKFGGGCGFGGNIAAWFLVLFILLVIIVACVL